MIEKGMRVTVNSDDPAYFPGYMTENLIAVQEEADLSKTQLLQLARNSFEAAWLPRASRDRYLAELSAYAA
jgi:adenine deaminase